MNMVAVFKALGPIDLRNVRRDSLLAWMPLLPLLVALLFRRGVPALTGFVQTQWAFDLTPFHPFIVSTYLVLAPVMVGMVVGFLLLDERDEQMTRAFLVMPVRFESVLLYRISVPLVVGVIVTLLGYPLIGLIRMPFPALLTATLLGALSAPLLALFLATLAENKVAGFAIMKLANGILLIPTAAYFVAMPWQLLAGVVPTYWAVKVFWLAAAGQSYGIYALIGVAINGVALWWLLRRFMRMVHRLA